MTVHARKLFARRPNARMLAILASVALGAGTLGLVTSGAAVPSEVRLHLGSNGRSFTYGSTTQTLTVGKNSCAINSAEPVMALSSNPTNPSNTTHFAPGLGTDGIGVKGGPSSGNGTPCSQVDGTESLQLIPGANVAGRSFTGVRLDLEMTGNAIVKLTLAGGTSSQVYQLQTGTSITSDQLLPGEGFDTTVPYTASSAPGDTTDACAAASSSGPNNSANDNCEWTVNPGFNFDHVTLSTVSIGTVALEGSNDFGNDPNFDSLFYLANGAPTPANDTVSTNEDTAKSGNVLTNDTDPEDNPLSASLVSGPSHGSLSLAADGSFTYTPASNYHGSDSFTYAASDGSLRTNATANITVVSVNDAPVAANDTVSTNEDTVATGNVLTNDTDPDNDTLSASLVSGPSNGTLSLAASGAFTYTPASNFNGSDSFTYKANDGQAQSNTATVSITVYQTICTDETVTATDGDATGSFTRLSDVSPCKRYTLAALSTDNTVSFVPTGTATINYRAFVSFGPDPTPAPPGTGPLPLQYDPLGGTDYRPVPWCVDPHFDTNDRVTSATIPAGNSDTWCIAQADTRPDATGQLDTTWQVFGQDDPVFHR